MSSFSNTSDGSLDFTATTTTGGVILAVVLGVEMILGLSMNLFIIVCSLYHFNQLKKSVDIYLLGLSVVNLSTCVLVMPLPITTIAAEGWIFGATVEQQVMTCKFSGWLFSTVNVQLVVLLAIISIDRCLFIVKPLIHKQYATKRIVSIILISIWIIVPLYTSMPFYGFGDFHFSRDLYLCVAQGTDVVYNVYSTVVILVLIAIILATTIWTFVHTHRFLKAHGATHRELKRMPSVPEAAANIAEDHIYTKRTKKLFGLFSLLLVAQLVALGPIAMVAVLRSVVPPTSLPASVLHTALPLFYTNNITNPLIQSHFRQDFKAVVNKGMDYIKNTCKKRQT